MNHAFGDLVDGAVATRHHDQVRAALDVAARDRAGGARTGRRRNRHVVTARRQDRGYSPGPCAALPPESARPQIVDEDGVPVAGYVMFSRWQELSAVS